MIMETNEEITPFEGIGELRFGSLRAAVREVLGSPDDIVRKPNWSSQLTDFYMTRGWSLTYDPDGMLAEIELFGPARVSVRGIDLLGRPAGQVLGELRSIDSTGANTNSPYEFPGIGISVDLHSGDLGESLRSVSAFASSSARGPEPEFFPGSPQQVQRPIEVGHNRVGSLRTPCDRQSMRSFLGEGMAINWYGTPVDVYFQGIVVEYDANDFSTRVVVTGSGLMIQDLPAEVTLGMPYSDCLRTLIDRGFDCVEKEAEIGLPGAGISILMARGGDPALPISAIAVESPPRT
jgi:hypothetical protein